MGERAQPIGEASADIANTDAHQFRHLRATPMIHLPLTEAQANKVNAALQQNQNPSMWLSPLQRALLTKIESALTANADALDGLIFPSDPAALRGYADRLDAKLAEFVAPGQ
ncbi:hypothetical protein OT109_19215 [Phycisphaeraceae bacterium D3-23]